ncbi:MAG: hypothetical protein E7279_02285 [Lachnospiraceae bacterium]|nr:hypothetical protein [Lachnospiraceae bacterium]
MYYEDGLVLCGASSYNKKFYFNEDFDLVPKQVKDELKIMCVLFTEDVGGTIQLIYDDEGNLEIVVDKEEDDILYDEIGSVLKVKQLQREKKELFESLETFYKVMVEPQ